MKLPKHLQKLRDLQAYKCEFTTPFSNRGMDFINGYDQAVADMLKEIEPLIQALIIEFDETNMDASWRTRLNVNKALQDWQAKFGDK